MNAPSQQGHIDADHGDAAADNGINVAEYPALMVRSYYIDG
jgi:hypothetical protein